MKVVKIVVSELKPAFLIGIAGGVIAVLLTMLMGALPTDGISLIAISIALLVMLVLIATKVGLKSLSLYNAVKLFAGIAIVGSIFNLFLPGVSQFILSAPEFTVNGLLMSFIYVGAGMYLLKMLKVKA